VIYFLFGGKQRGTILILGYASTKRLRNPALLKLKPFIIEVKVCVCCSKLYSVFSSQGFTKLFDR
jgi:hypothetical protein